MSDASPALSLAFFDSAKARHGMIRSGVTLLFEDKEASAVSETPQIEETGTGYRAAVNGSFELEFLPFSEPADLGPAKTRLCTVTGTVGRAEVECLGLATETTSPPEWSEIGALRAVSALFDREHAVLALGRRPAGASGHGEELITAWLLDGGELRGVEDARISTVYDSGGRQRSSGIELWLPGDEFPRRAFGTASAGTSLDLQGLRVHAAVFSWRMEGREGAGTYELMLRDAPPEAA